MLISGRTLRAQAVWDVHPFGPRDAKHATAITSFHRDIDGDGEIDLVIGDYSHSAAQLVECGAVWIFSGTAPTPARTFYGMQHHDWFGYAVHVIPDLTGDAAAHPELLIGAPGTFDHSYGPDENGNYVAMWFGEALGVAAVTLRGESVGAMPGSFFAGFIDSGDYLPEATDRATASFELFVSARHHSQSRGLVSCFEFEALTPAWRPHWTLEGHAPGDKIGRPSARGRITVASTDAQQADAGDELLLGTAHPRGADDRKHGHVWCFSAADGVDASSSIRGSGWAGDDLDPSLVPTIDLAAPPLLGTTSRVRVACPLEPSTLGLLLVGLGDATTPELPHLLVSDYLVRPFVMNGVAGVIDVEVPADPALFTTGKRYFAQAVLALPGVEGGIGYTPLVEAVVGGLDW